MAPQWIDLDFGSVSSWFAAIIASASFAVAANAYRRSVVEREAEQASKVSAWVAIERDASSNVSLAVLRIANSSEASIYELSAFVDGHRLVASEKLIEGSTTAYDLRGIAFHASVTVHGAESCSTGVHSRVTVDRRAVVGAGSQVLPMRAAWMASMARMPWLRADTR